jgi:hypothetical protein
MKKAELFVAAADRRGRVETTAFRIPAKCVISVSVTP